MATAPQAIWNLWYRIRDEWMGAGTQDEELSGIVGDALHSFGFHLSPNELPSSDYSLQTARDKAGAHAHPDDASALDVHFGPRGMVTATTRLIAAAKARDPRMDCLYEFCGTTNGTSPHAYTVDRHEDDPNNTGQWSDSHVTHVHLSIHRDVCDNFDAIKGVADIIAGIGNETQPFGGVMAFYKDRAEFEATLATIAEAAAEQAINRRLLADPQHPHGLPNNPGVNLRDVAAAVLLPDTPKPGHK